ncbi:MAG TPA: hypothetical protein VNC50_10280 [Planctomycetia bacterium]|nr:hypothetical protein [Planctomycetia bacterium]
MSSRWSSQSGSADLDKSDVISAGVEDHLFQSTGIQGLFRG